MKARWWQASGRAEGGGAIALFGLRALDGPSLDHALDRLGLGRIARHAVRLCVVHDVDDLVAARVDDRTLWITPHGGIETARRVRQWLGGVGVEAIADQDASERFPEAADLIEARVLEALTRAASPRAVEMLLAQPSLWQRGPRHPSEPADARDRALHALIEPALVVVVGRPNAGKSTLLNALAGRGVALASGTPGTTLDHVGAYLELDGVVVRWVDTPGLEQQASSPEQQEAQQIARAMVGQADLVLQLAEASDQYPPADMHLPPGSMLVASKTDLIGEACPNWAECGVSATRGDGLESLARKVRQRLVPDWCLQDERPWRFWSD